MPLLLKGIKNHLKKFFEKILKKVLTKIKTYCIIKIVPTEKKQKVH